MRRACKYFLNQTVHDFGKTGVMFCRNKSSNSRNEKTSSLKKWHDVVAAIPTSQILPTRFGNKSGTAVTEAAWYGDKLIGEQVALQLHKFLLSMNGIIASDEEKHKNVRRGMHMLHGVAVSNQLFADELKVILPSHAPKNVTIVSQKEVHDTGTMIEAAVYAVSSLSDDALATLAKFLIVQAAQGKETLPRVMNEKLLNFMEADSFESAVTGKQKANSIFQRSTFIIEELSEKKALSVLNKYGGNVDCMDLNQHPPKFRATAALNGTVVSSEASRKKSAKRHAAYTLLKKMKKANNQQIFL